MDMAMREAESCFLCGQIKAENHQTNSFDVTNLLRATTKLMKMRRRNKKQERSSHETEREREARNLLFSCLVSSLQCLVCVSLCVEDRRG